jgi:hypothetical protein
MSSNVLLSALIERHGLGALDRCRSPLGISCVNWVDALLTQPAAVSSLRSGFCKAHGIERTKTHETFFSGRGCVSINPTLGGAPLSGRDLQIKAAAISMQLDSVCAVGTLPWLRAVYLYS